jgi:hypothetical protein
VDRSVNRYAEICDRRHDSIDCKIPWSELGVLCVFARVIFFPIPYLLHLLPFMNRALWRPHFSCLENSPYRRKRRDTIEPRWVIPQDLSPRRFRQLAIVGEVAHGVLRKLLCGVGMRIVGGHDEVVVADVLDEAAD